MPLKNPGAPVDATYIVQTANAELTAEQILASLSTGLMFVTTTTGAITSVVPGTGVITALGQNVTGSGGIVLATSPTITTAVIAQDSPLAVTNPTNALLVAVGNETNYQLGVLNTTYSTLPVDGWQVYQYNDGSVEMDGATSLTIYFPSGVFVFDSMTLTGAFTGAATNPGVSFNYAALNVANTQNASSSGHIVKGGSVSLSLSNDADEAECLQIFTQHSAGSVSGAVTGISSTQTFSGTSAIGRAIGLYGVMNFNDSAAVNDAMLSYVDADKDTGTVGVLYGYWSGDLFGLATTKGYFLWYDGGPGGDANKAGVFRVDDFGILAYYNPAFTKYTPGATNFEREIIRWGDTGVFGTDDNAYIGVEVGGTGTNRNLNVLGAEVGVMTIPGTYGVLRAGGYKSSDGSAGATGTATAVNTLTVKNGLITNIA